MKGTKIRTEPSDDGRADEPVMPVKGPRLALCEPEAAPAAARTEHQFEPLGWGAPPHEPTYRRLLEGCHAMVRHRKAIAETILETLVQSRVDEELSNAELLAHLVAEPLLRRLDHRLVNAKNIYLQEFDIPQIELFYQMSVSYPQVGAAHDLANQFQAHALEGVDELSLFEIGIGKGVQLVDLLERVASRNAALRHARIFALDPDVDNLDDAAGWLRRTGERLGIRVSYFPIRSRLEDLSLEGLQNIRSMSGDSMLLVNSAFAFHHTSHPVGDQQRRTELLADIARELRPRLMTLVEPNANHDVESLPKRFDACWRHFGTVFDLIDESGLPPEACFSIKYKFFGREIEDIFGASDGVRCERHELTDSWLLRCRKAGFVPYDGDVALTTSMPAYCDEARSPGVVRLGYRSRPLIGVIAMQSEAAGARLADGGA